MKDSEGGDRRRGAGVGWKKSRGKEEEEEKDKKEGHQDAGIAEHVAKSAECWPSMKKALGWTPPGVLYTAL